jgi:antitoxin (DNA-binding transcriptional repressor) of toxin-antitoxin stability system
MPESIVNIHAAKTQLSRLVALAEKGRRITIARAGKPVAQLGPAPKAKRRHRPTDDPLLRVEEYAFDGPVENLTNTEMDRIVYGL